MSQLDSRFFIKALPVATLCALLFSCGKPASTEIVDSTPIPEAAAREMIGKMTTSLIGELTTTIADKGPAVAIDVCSGQAPIVAGELSAGEFSIRRIGNRVRNAEVNTPTADERKIMESLTPDSPHFQGEISGRPVFMKGLFIPSDMCLTCHGTNDQIPADVQAALAERYPDDEAIDYAVGDLRGAILVERNPQQTK
jgi:hypothetical protein